MKKKFNIKAKLVKTGALGAGAVAAKAVNKVLPSLNPKIRSGLKIAVGLFGPDFVPKSEMVRSVGDGMVAMGVAELVGSFVPALAGTEEFIIGEAWNSDMYLEDSPVDELGGLGDDNAIGEIQDVD